MKIQVKDLYKSYKNLHVIKGLSIDFSSDKIHCIFGPSGCGKTTFVNIMAGLVEADKGKIEGIEDKRVSYIFQEDRLLPWATVKENLMFVLQDICNIQEASLLVEKYLSLVGLKKFKDSYPDELSGGMKRRTAIARAFAYGGDIFIMDEGFKGLDFQLKKSLMEYIINYWHMKDRFFFFITHDVDEALYMADTIYVFDGPPLTLKKKLNIEIPYIERKNYKNKLKEYKELILKKE